MASILMHVMKQQFLTLNVLAFDMHWNSFLGGLLAGGLFVFYSPAALLTARENAAITRRPGTNLWNEHARYMDPCLHTSDTLPLVLNSKAYSSEDLPSVS